MDIFDQLDLKKDYQKNKSLFDIKQKQNQKINGTECIKRIRFICKVYMKWIEIKSNQVIHQNNIKIMSIYDIINNKLSDNYNINRFLDDYRFITYHRRDILPFHDDENDEIEECDINSCYIDSRNQRNKTQMATNNNLRNEMFFINDDNDHNDDNDDNNKDIVIQSILDSLHIFIYHTLRIRFQKYIESKSDDEVEHDDGKQNMEDDIACFDGKVKELGDVIKQKRKSSNRYRRAGLRRYSVKNNKFVTKNTSIPDDYNNTNGDQFTLCFIDYLFRGINESKSNIHQRFIDKFKTFLSEQEYDTDSICQDVNNYPQSNILNNTNEYEKENQQLLSILNKFVYIETSHKTLYSAGYRYFYWKYYENIENEANVLWIRSSGQPACESNPGYKIKDWFIPRKYKDLREELLTNKISTVSLHQFNNIKQQATMKLKNWLNDPETRPLESQHQNRKERAWAEKCYGIKQHTSISVQHIMALMFYTNFSDQSAAFSATFRRKHGFETDENLKARNREVWNWSKLLRECVECYGQNMGFVYKKLPYLWHGVSAELIFDSTYIKLCGPLSSTAGMLFCLLSILVFILTKRKRTTQDFVIAHTVFGADGIVIDIKVRKEATTFMDCNYWSCFVHENERLLIGGLDPLEIEAIRNIPLSQNYSQYIKVINIFGDFKDGMALLGIKPNGRDVLRLASLIDSELNVSAEESDVPAYIQALFHHFLTKQTQILINPDHLNQHFIFYFESFGMSSYGYQKFQKLFMVEDVINFVLFIKLMRNLKVLTVLDANARGVEQSIEINSKFAASIFSCIEHLSSSFSSLSFSRFEIVRPKTKINEFIEKYQEKFVTKGWKLKKEIFMKPEYGIKGAEMLAIEKVEG